MRDLFATIAGIAAVQKGRVTTAQLRAAGVSKQRTTRWIADGRLHRLHAGVYAVGHAGRSTDADYMAAVLAGGEGAVLSNLAAAHVMRLLPGRPPPPEITVPTLAGRTRPGIVIHRVKALHRLDVTVVDGIPITIVPRILLDIAPGLELTKLTRACHEAWVRHRTQPRHAEACIARNPTKKGIAKLRRALGSDATLSDLEAGFLALLREHGMRLPRTNIDLQGDKVDCHWPQLDLTVELQSYRFHASRQAFEADIARRRRSSHMAFSYGDVFERGPQTIAELAATMRR
jgi:hypothetical protein